MVNKNINKKTWEEFRKSGFLWFINMILHAFGWAIIFNIEDGKLIEVYPARVKFRGFSETSNNTGYANISEYLRMNSDDLYDETRAQE